MLIYQYLKTSLCVPRDAKIIMEVLWAPGTTTVLSLTPSVPEIDARVFRIQSFRSHHFAQYRTKWKLKSVTETFVEVWSKAGVKTTSSWCPSVMGLHIRFHATYSKEMMENVFRNFALGLPNRGYCSGLNWNILDLGHLTIHVPQSTIVFRLAWTLNTRCSITLIFLLLSHNMMPLNFT